ncbi:hypothetical protein JZK55_23510 [Dissulfurispira thermophila]|uniref:Uncharacterized protein n=1 Tax=Dissulfurispira thermophila TaxID=2715679 RepID=A0A7G1H5A6_9BACT|nr:hypothetical protein JZK55_23510 [Dissulfurispira thermophila]
MKKEEVVLVEVEAQGEAVGHNPEVRKNESLKEVELSYTKSSTLFNIVQIVQYGTMLNYI